MRTHGQLPTGPRTIICKLHDTYGVVTLSLFFTSEVKRDRDMFSQVKGCRLKISQFYNWVPAILLSVILERTVKGQQLMRLPLFFLRKRNWSKNASQQQRWYYTKREERGAGNEKHDWCHCVWKIHDSRVGLHLASPSVVLSWLLVACMDEHVGLAYLTAIMLEWWNRLLLKRHVTP